MLIMGNNSWRYEITHNNGELQDAVCLKRILMKITLRHNQDIQTTSEDSIVRNSLRWANVNELYYFIYFILFIQYFQRVAPLASLASLPSGPL